MKSPAILFFVIVTNIFLLTIVLFFRDRFLFFLAGFNFNLTKETSVESFQAFAAIQKWRIGIIVITIFIGAVNIICCKMLEKTRGSKWYLTTGSMLGSLSVIFMIIILFMSIIVPNRVF
ncbi:MAG: hypothetical protein ABIN67_03730 [Ferruginibacter sp.]